MIKKPNFWKCMTGVFVLAVLFVGIWATTSARSTTAKKPTELNKVSAASVNLNALPPMPTPSPSPDPISSVFEVDGDIFDIPPLGNDDWSLTNCDTGTSLDKTFLHDGLDTSIFTQGGSKDPSDISVLNSKGVLIPGWKHTDGAVPDKDEIINAYAAVYSGSPNGDTIVAFGADRYSNQGDSFFGAWFFQKNVYAASDGSFREQVGSTPDEATDPLAVHVIGDVLVLINFTGGGGTATGQVLEWVPPGTPCPVDAVPIGQEATKTLCDITGTAPLGSVLGVSNDLTGDQDIPDDCLAQAGQTQSWDALYTPKSGSPGVIPAAHFFEGAINLDAFPALQNACFNSFLIETRSSSSPSAQLKDFVVGELDTCPEIGLTKEANDTEICTGSPTTYTYTVNNPTSLNLTITLVDDNETPEDLTDDLDVLDDCAAYNMDGMGTLSTEVVGPGETVFTCMRTLSVGTHTNIAKVTATIAGASDDATATETVVVADPPTAEAGDPQTVCKNSGFTTHDFTLAGSGTNGTPSWEILSSGGTAGCSIMSGGDTYTPVVRCTAFGTATAKLTVTSDGPEGTDCPDATDEVVLTINPNATAAAGDDEAVCVDDTFTSTEFNLSGSVTNANPSWSIVGPNSASCTITAGENSLTPTVTCTALGTATVQLLADSDNGCTDATDELVLTVNANPEANAGDDQIACSAGETTPFTLAGSADHGTSAWTCVSGDCGQVSITDPSSLTSGVVFTGTGSATLKLTTTSNTSPTCGSTEDTVVLTVDPNPTVTICNDEACSTDENLALTANVSPGTGTITYSWSGPMGGITSDPTLATITVVLPGTYTVNVTRKATSESDACPAMQTFHVGLCGGAVCDSP